MRQKTAKTIHFEPRSYLKATTLSLLCIVGAGFSSLPAYAYESQPSLVNVTGIETAEAPSLQVVLFPKGIKSIRPIAVKQAFVGDCQALSSISSLARTQRGKDLIMSYFSYPDEFHVEVKLPGAPKSIVFDVAMLNQIADVLHTDTNPHGLWGAVLEATLGLLRWEEQGIYVDSDDFLANLKFGKLHHLNYVPVQSIMAQLTGMPTTYRYFEGISKERAHTYLSQARNRLAVIAGALSESFPKQEVCEEIVTNHAYSVLAYDVKKRMVTIRDPRGELVRTDMQTGTSIGYKGYGITVMPLSDFIKLFQIILYSTM